VHTATKFRQKTCPKCKANHDNETVLCSFCIDKEQRRKSKQQPGPDNYLVECLIEREGDTTVIVGGMTYLFKKNEQGHSVCDVVNRGHYNAFVGKMGRLYRAYRPDEDYPEQDQEPVVEPDEPEQDQEPVVEPDGSGNAVESDDDNWPIGNTQEPVVAIKESDHDSAGADNREAGQETGRGRAGNDRPGGGKRGGARDRAGAGAPQERSGATGDQPELHPGSDIPNAA
jgi:hypothetical protein